MSKSFRISIKNRYNSLHSFFFLGSGLLRPSLVCISGFCPVLAHSHQSSGFCPVLAHSHQRIRDWLKTDWTVQELLFVCFGQCQFSTKIPCSLSELKCVRHNIDDTIVLILGCSFFVLDAAPSAIKNSVQISVLKTQSNTEYGR